MWVFSTPTPPGKGRRDSPCIPSLCASEYGAGTLRPPVSRRAARLRGCLQSEPLVTVIASGGRQWPPARPRRRSYRSRVGYGAVGRRMAESVRGEILSGCGDCAQALRVRPRRRPRFPPLLREKPVEYEHPPSPSYGEAREDRPAVAGLRTRTILGRSAAEH